jgi:phosphoserine phosphatase
MSSKKVIVTVSGPDHPGITKALMEIVTNSGERLVDMGQSVTHNLLSLSFVLETTQDHVLKDLLFECNQMGLQMAYQAIDDSTARQFDQGEKFILSCVAINELGASFIAKVAKVLSENKINIQRIDKIGAGAFKNLEIATTTPDNADLKPVKEELMNISHEFNVDMAFIKDNVFRRSKRLIVFDMDSTLIQTEVIDEMADVMGVGDQVRAITEEAMNGEMDFDESLKKRVSLLKGLKQEQMHEILQRLPLTPGVEEFTRTIKNLGYKVAIISGGFSYFAEALKEKLGLDYAFANELDFKNGELTGEVCEPIVNASQKAILLKLMAQQEKISLEQVVAIGDGANDLPMLSTAGLGIAFHAKEIVKQKAQQHMSFGPMTTILYFLGIPGPQ